MSQDNDRQAEPDEAQPSAKAVIGGRPAPAAPRDQPQQARGPLVSAEEISASSFLPDDAPGARRRDTQRSVGAEPSPSSTKPSLPPRGAPSVPVPNRLPPISLPPPPPNGRLGGLSAPASSSKALVPQSFTSQVDLAADSESETEISRPAEAPLKAWVPASGPQPSPNESEAQAVAPLEQPDAVDDIEMTTLPQGRIGITVDAVRRAMRQLNASVRPMLTQRRPKWFLWIIAGAGLLVGIGIVTFVASLTRRVPDASEASKPRREPSPASPAPSGTAAAAVRRACVVAGAPHPIAPAAVLASGIEVRALDDATVAVGFASAEREAVGIRLDATSLAQVASASVRAKSQIRHVTPILSSKGAFALAIDADRRNDAIQGRRTVPLDSPVQVGASEDGIVWSRSESSGAEPWVKLWSLEGEGPVEAIRGAVDDAAGDKTVVLSFRRGNAVDLGVASEKGDLAAQGALTRIPGLGAGVGSPSAAINDGVIVAAWADRSAAAEPWGVRWMHFRVGEGPPAPGPFVPPPGGRGEQAMSPSLTAMRGKRFLLVWTEGPASGHEVRALTMTEEGEPIGEPLRISKPDANSGQGQAAVTPSGRGVVAYLESTDHGFEVVATPVVCEL